MIGYRRFLIGLAVCAALLTTMGSANAQYYYPTYPAYNPYIGAYRGRRGGLQSLHGQIYGGAIRLQSVHRRCRRGPCGLQSGHRQCLSDKRGYNPYTGRVGAGAAVYNPYTGGAAVRYGVR